MAYWRLTLDVFKLDIFASAGVNLGTLKINIRCI